MKIMIFQSNTVLNGKQSVPYKATVYGLLMSSAVALRPVCFFPFLGELQALDIKL